MKIFAFHLLNDYSGSPKVLMQLCRGWVAAGHAVQLATSEGEGGFLTDIPGVPTHPVRYRFYRSIWMRLWAFAWSQVRLFFYTWRVVRQPDIVYVNTVLPFGAAVAGRLRGARVVYHVHETTVRPHPLRWFLYRVMRACAAEVVLVSDYMAQAVPLGDLPYHVLPNALDADWLASPGPQHTDRKSANVLMLCSLKAYKGVDVMVELANLRPDLNFRLVLNATTTAIAAYWKDKALPVNLQMYPTQREVRPHYAWADLVLNLSLPDQWVETFGLTALEAMAMGLPVVVPPVGGIAELVEPGRQGLHVDARDMPALLRAIDTLLEEEAYPRFSAQARERAKAYDVESFLASSLHLLSNPASSTWKKIPKSGNVLAVGNA